MWRNIEKTVAEFAKFSPRDAKAYRQMMTDYDAIKKVFGRYRYTPIGYGPTLDEMLMAEPNGALWAKRHKQSAWDVISQTFENEQIRTFMLWLAFMTIQPVDSAGTGRLAYALANGRQNYSWVTPVGGSGALPNALCQLIREQGGEILTGKAVSQLIIEEGRCVGVQTEDGSNYRAEKAVLSTIHIKHLVDMAPTATWEKDPTGNSITSFTESVAQWEPGFTLFVSHYALKSAPQFLVGAERQAVVAAGVAGSTDNLLRLMSAVRRGVVHQDDPVLLIVSSSVVDPSRAPIIDGAQGHTLKVMSFFPYDLADGGPERWDSIKEEVAQRNLDHLRKHVPNLTNDLILGHVVESPIDLERRNRHNWRGTCHGGALLPSQSGPMRPVPGWAGYRMPILGLYQTGATTHPGGSVSAGPGRNAAWVILDDLGIDPPFETT